MYRLLGFLCALIAVSAPDRASAQITETPRGWLFRAKFTPGTTMKYRLDVKTESEALPGGSKEQWSLYNLNCKKVVKDTAFVHYELEKDEEGEYKGIYLLLKIDRRGRALWGKEPMQRFGVHFPEGPIKIGGAFSGEGLVSMSTLGAAKARDTYTFMGVRTEGSRRRAELRVESGAASDPMKASGVGAILLDVADGSLVSMSYEQTAHVTHEGKSVEFKQKAVSTRIGTVRR